jgi:hypothetical protein
MQAKEIQKFYKSDVLFDKEVEIIFHPEVNMDGIVVKV